MNTSLIPQILIGILAGVGLAIVYQMARMQAGAHKGYEALAGQLKATHQPETRTLPEQLTDSILAGHDALFSDIITGHLGDVAFTITNIVLAEASQINDVTYSVASVQTTATFPHFLIIPDHVAFMYTPMELQGEHNLKPAELEGTGIQVYVAAGYELEALQILTPPVLEKLQGLGSVIEGMGSNLVVIRPRYANSGQYVEILTEAFNTATTIKGLSAPITPIGDLPLTLRPSRFGQFAVGSGRLILIFVGSLTALAVLTLVLGLLILHFKK